jgi:hypothetical protein
MGRRSGTVWNGNTVHREVNGANGANGAIGAINPNEEDL